MPNPTRHKAILCVCNESRYFAINISLLSCTPTPCCLEVFFFFYHGVEGRRELKRYGMISAWDGVAATHLTTHAWEAMDQCKTLKVLFVCAVLHPESLQLIKVYIN